jgi:hypothetical protein
MNGQRTSLPSFFIPAVRRGGRRESCYPLDAWQPIQLRYTLQ